MKNDNKIQKEQEIFEEKLDLPEETIDLDDEDIEDELELEDEIEDNIEENLDEIDDTEDYTIDADSEDYSIDDEPTNNKMDVSKIINIVFIAIIVILSLITLDVTLVSRFEKGPIFTIRTKVYNDGGTKEYYGIGYKVYKYNCKDGRKGLDIGPWSLKYNDKVVEIPIIDLAIAYNDNTRKTHNDFYRKYIKTTGKVIESNKNNIIIKFEDQDKKYNLKVNCNLLEENSKDIKIGSEVTVRGVVKDFKFKNEKDDNTLYLNNSYID